MENYQIKRLVIKRTEGYDYGFTDKTDTFCKLEKNSIIVNSDMLLIVISDCGYESDGLSPIVELTIVKRFDENFKRIDEEYTTVKKLRLGESVYVSDLGMRISDWYTQNSFEISIAEGEYDEEANKPSPFTELLTSIAYHPYDWKYLQQIRDDHEKQ